jgi:hypothetical protein
MPPIVFADNSALGGADVSELRECEALYGERR